jgi:hypothetical protein
MPRHGVSRRVAPGAGTGRTYPLHIGGRISTAKTLDLINSAVLMIIGEFAAGAAEAQEALRRRAALTWRRPDAASPLPD